MVAGMGLILGAVALVRGASRKAGGKRGVQPRLRLRALTGFWQSFPSGRPPQQEES
jgi:hypothetical protein